MARDRRLLRVAERGRTQAEAKEQAARDEVTRLERIISRLNDNVGHATRRADRLQSKLDISQRELQSARTELAERDETTRRGPNYYCVNTTYQTLSIVDPDTKEHLGWLVRPEHGKWRLPNTMVEQRAVDAAERFRANAEVSKRVREELAKQLQSPYLIVHQYAADLRCRQDSARRLWGTAL